LLVSCLLPESAEELQARERVEEARNHIDRASDIISSIKVGLGSQTQQLDLLLDGIEDKKQLSQRHEVLAKAGQDQFAAFKGEMEDALRQELTSQSEWDKLARRLASAF
jgi:hypothetical protein